MLYINILSHTNIVMFHFMLIIFHFMLQQHLLQTEAYTFLFRIQTSTFRIAFFPILYRNIVVTYTIFPESTVYFSIFLAPILHIFYMPWFPLHITYSHKTPPMLLLIHIIIYHKTIFNIHASMHIIFKSLFSKSF